MKIVFRGTEIIVIAPNKFSHSAKWRTHVLIRNKKDKTALIDVKIYSFGPYVIPWGYEMIAWILVGTNKEIMRNYDLEETSIGTLITRFNVRITDDEFKLLNDSISNWEVFEDEM